MKNKGCVVLGFLLYLLSFLALSSHAGQGDALGLFMWKKRFNGNAHTEEAKMGSSKLSVSSGDRRFRLSEIVQPQKGLKEKDKIKTLPGQPGNVKFHQYGGYVTVNEKAGRALFYYFVEAKKNKDVLPLIIWFNGGPGCSSLGFGAMDEIGPFRVSSDAKTLYKNKFAWNNVANVLFIESPAGIGFSYTNTSSDFEVTGDQSTADDAYIFLMNWLERFPEYKNRKLYLTGESYAGHYVPQLALTILKHNKEGNQSIDLQGIAIGNPVLDDRDDEEISTPRFEYLLSHNLISDEIMESIRAKCDCSKYVSGRIEESCYKSLIQTVPATLNIVPDNIYGPFCKNNVTAKPKRHSIQFYDPCSEKYVLAYLNRPEVQSAIHANVTELNYPWKGCSDFLYKPEKWADSVHSVLPILKELLDNRIRVLVYSGDIDFIVPVTCTKTSLKRLNLKEKFPWYAWNSSSETGGLFVEYEEGLTFATVRGAGHMVPSYQPERALMLIKYFLDGVPLPALDPPEVE
ncbi:serine carboxypeptidase-like 40 [Telopea speciosissima]|uniref:serine carboxypeptidase-like 40 n=1 Tax=Telopea speciosissima TaxID=54955 RepID=UPI001CC58E99|nr:serine carboxypeptidase-like 40 [Telopea speciosissima]